MILILVRKRWKRVEGDFEKPLFQRMGTVPLMLNSMYNASIT